MCPGRAERVSAGRGCAELVCGVGTGWLRRVEAGWRAELTQFRDCSVTGCAKVVRFSGLPSPRMGGELSYSGFWSGSGALLGWIRAFREPPGASAGAAPAGGTHGARRGNARRPQGRRVTCWPPDLSALPRHQDHGRDRLGCPTHRPTDLQPANSATLDSPTHHNRASAHVGSSRALVEQNDPCNPHPAHPGTHQPSARGGSRRVARGCGEPRQVRLRPGSNHRPLRCWCVGTPVCQSGASGRCEGG